MEKTAICTSYEAAALWELERSNARDFDGLVLILDMDRAAFGICRCRPDKLPVQVKTVIGSAGGGSFFREVVTALLPDCADPEGLARTLYDSVQDPAWVRAQKNYLRSGGTVDIPLPSLVAEGQVCSMTCAALDDFFKKTRRELLTDMIARAKDRIRILEAEDTCRIVPVGELARLFLAEYLIREAFLPMPLLPDDRLRTCTAQEDPAGIYEQGFALYRNAMETPRMLDSTLRLQVLRRNGAKLSPELLPLAESGTAYQALENVRYVGPVCVSEQSGLTLFANDRMHRLAIPDGLLPTGSAMSFLETGVGISGDRPTLMLRSSDGRTAQIPLDMI